MIGLADKLVTLHFVGEERVRDDFPKRRQVDPTPLSTKGKLKKSAAPEKGLPDDSDDDDESKYVIILQSICRINVNLLISLLEDMAVRHFM